MQVHIKLPKLKGFYISISRKKPFEKEVIVVERPQTQNTLPKDQVEQNLDRVNGWIGNCDQKASFLLTLVGVIATIICTGDTMVKVKEILVEPFFVYWKEGAGCFDTERFFLALFLCSGLLCLLGAIIFLLICLMAKTDYSKFEQPGIEKKSHMFYGSIAKMKYDEFKNATNDCDNDLLSQFYINSVICNAKFDNYKIAVKFVFVAIPLLVIALLLALSI